MKEALKKIIPQKTRLYIREKIIPSLARVDIAISRNFFGTKNKLYRRFLANSIKKRGFQKINIGCGPKGIKGWLNFGLFPSFRIPYGLVFKKNSIYYLNYDLSAGLPLKNNSIKHIYNSHFIEHLDLKEGIEFFKEVYRVLKPGGIIRTSCPDLEKYAQKYIERDLSFFKNKQIKEFCFYKEAHTPGEIFIAKAYDNINCHRWFYDKESLTHLLKKTGFKDIYPTKVHESKIKNITIIEPKYRAIESLYLEARK